MTGLNNTITDTSYSFAGGQGCSIAATANYSFVWGQNGSVAAGANNSVVFSDSSAATTSNTANTFVIRASGGYWFYSSSNNTAGVRLVAGNSSWGTISDVRAKENIHDLMYGLDAVLAMKPLIYNYIGNSAEQNAVGFSAQDMRKVVPEVVDVPKDSSKMMSIRYSELIPVLAKAIQELKREKDAKESALEKENAELRTHEERDRTEIASLKASNEKLAAIVGQMEELKKAVDTMREKENGVTRTVALSR